MRPLFRVLVENQDITDKIADRLLSLNVTDEAGIESDAMSIFLDDRDHAIALPPTGTELNIAIGYVESGLTDMGLYTVDEIELSGPVQKMCIRGKASHTRKTKMLNTLKAPKTRSWDQTSIGAIVTKIAVEHNFEPVISKSLIDTPIPHIDQVSESDINLLSRMAKDYGAIAKPASGRLLFVVQGEGKTVSGQKMPTIPLTIEEVSTWRVLITERPQYKSVVTKWQNLDAAILVQEQVGEGGPCYEMQHTYPNSDAAKAAARAKLASLHRGVAGLELRFPGRTDIQAECFLSLDRFREGVNGRWIVSRVEHNINNTGYSCTLSAERPKGGS